MFYRPLAKKLRPFIKHQAREAVEARAELRENFSFSDAYLCALIFGGVAAARHWGTGIHTASAIYGALVLYALLFLVYLAIKEWEKVKYPHLAKTDHDEADSFLGSGSALRQEKAREREQRKAKKID